ncbi:MAG TPA: hypothetical protein VH701_03855, partial [Vicinamibacterales bacterium]
MEPTVGRANLQSETATANGVNLTWIAYANLAGLESGPLRGRRRSAVWVNEYTDLQSGLARVRRGDLSFGSWVHSYRRPRYYAWFSWSDPMPAVVMGLRLARKAVIRGVQSIFGRSTRPESSGAETVPELSAPSLGPQR